MKAPRFLVVLMVLMPLAASAEIYKIDSARSRIAFSLHQFLSSVQGEFHRFSGTIEVNREHPEESSVITRISIASIDTHIRKRDQHLLSSEFFDAAKFPEITFKSRRVTHTGTNSADIVGDLTMHGVTREITLNVQLLSNDGSRWRVTTAPLRRSQFGLMFSKSAEMVSGIADEVAVDIEIAADRDK